ncbi:MAG: hypothetical protein ABI857_01120 [Acidobacteriota bacterium]
MREIKFGIVLLGSIILTAILIATGCQPPSANTTVANTNVSTNANTNSNANVSTTTTTTITASEPEQYQANIKLTIETLGETQKASTAPVGAIVARSGADRVMEFAMPTGEKVIYLDKGGMNYVILPNRKQYAELTKEALGFEVRRLLMPDQIVNQVKAIPGVRLVGDETMNGRAVTKYAYNATANTQTKAGTVATDSYVLVDKETSLPIRSETVSQSQSGGNVQGINGVRIVTEMTDIKTTPDANIFTLPSEFQKIDAEQVKVQANLIFNTIAAVIGQMVKQAQAPVMSPTPMASPTR